MAEAWDVLRGDTTGWPDRGFYLEAIRRWGQPALDVGCGTGRLLLDYVAQGLDVDGVDNSPEMLALCRAKAEAAGLDITVYQQYIEALDLARCYRTILVPSSTLQLITDAGTARQALARMVSYLLPGGALVAPFMTLWRAGDPLETVHQQSAERPTDGAVFCRVARVRFDPATDLEHTDTLYQRIVGGAIVAEERHVRSPATRSYTQAQARALFEGAGLVDIQAYHQFDWAQAQPDDTLFTLVGVRPEDCGDAG
jgi:SAM-dependent methyltransferase